MKTAFLTLWVTLAIAKTSVAEKLENDRGELGSWMILAAGLAAAAAAAVLALTTWFVTKTGNITSN